MKRENLPEGFEWSDFNISYETGDEILDYCKSCRNGGDCWDKDSLLEAMGENYPFWSDKFKCVDIDPLRELFCADSRRMICTGYESLQGKLFPEAFPFIDGVLKLINEVNLVTLGYD